MVSTRWCPGGWLCWAQVTVNHWLLQWGMSIGIGDTVADEATMNTINDIIEKVRRAFPAAFRPDHCGWHTHS